MRFHRNIRIAAARASSRFRRDRKGSVAVEFAFIAVPFAAMVFAILETGMIFFASQVLETATQDTARLIMTGQAQTGSMSAAQFKTSLCSRLTTMFDCNGNVDVDVKSYPTFAAVNLNNPVSSGTYTSASAYQPGHAGDIVVVRTYYQWPLFVTQLGFNPGNLNGNKRLLVATAAFRNEPGPF